ncbi:MAG: UDP-N-acetylmuramoyl-L-alanine--D-glutamate ligase [Oscillatoriales cyanobacterium]|nr:MAG: UDP-N-acetylmuramoyl-L-alanine--D-glutamate ligase [Oscillatoriales cyanobacterium]
MTYAHVIGLGKSGIAAARLLVQRGYTVGLSDQGTGDRLAAQQHLLEAEGITVHLGTSFTLEAFPETEKLIVSPGVPWDLPALEAARSQGIETLGEMELAWQTLGDRPWVGITGTNGKTTTTALTAAIFQRSGLRAPACGNIGFAACELALAPDLDRPIDWTIAELSSYQIESSIALAPTIGLWTTFTPDHLNRHYTLENYYAIKASLLHRSKHRVLNGDDPALYAHRTDWGGDAYWTSVQGYTALDGITPYAYIESGWVYVEGVKVVEVAALKMPGAHNQQNLLLAVAAARIAQLEPEAIAAAVADFPGVAHRLEVIDTWQGVRFVNDSKATNYDAAEVGLTSVEAPAILIAGGSIKEGDDAAWMDAIADRAAYVLLIGAASDAFAQRLTEIGYGRYECVETLDHAVVRSAVLAIELDAKTVLLSPACASFDQFSSFEERGDRFRTLCRALFDRDAEA